MNFVPVNRHLLVEAPRAKEERVGGFVLPSQYSESPNDYLALKVLGYAGDTQLSLVPTDRVVVQRGFLQVVEYGGDKYYIVPDTAVMGILRDV